MQVFRLVDGGRVDRLIGFDSLPDSVTSGITRGTSDGLPRSWNRFFGVPEEEKNKRPFFVLDYRWLNKDKDKWSEINSWIRRNVDADTRLLDKLEDMALPMAPDSKSQITLEPEDVPMIKTIKKVAPKPVEVVPTPVEAVPVEPKPEIVQVKAVDPKPKRVLSPEHLAKMKAGREKRKVLQRS